jgi:thioredoxin-dependent peroxiredoxin
MRHLLCLFVVCLTAAAGAAAEDKPMVQLKKGDNAPPFTLVNQDNKKISLAEYKGQKVLVYFYPKANTPGCTKQACSLREAQPDFQKLKMAVVGISPDEPAAQKKFDEEYKLGFPLLCDTDHKVAEAYGVWKEKFNFGINALGIVRSSFLVDEKGVIIQAWSPVKPEETVPLAKAELGK